MDMYQKRKIRQEKNSGQENKINKASINWYIPTLINFPRKPYFTRVYI